MRGYDPNSTGLSYSGLKSCFLGWAGGVAYLSSRSLKFEANEAIPIQRNRGNTMDIKTKNPGKFNRVGNVRTRSGKIIELSMSARDAIRTHCTECLGWEVHPKDCTAPTCPLYEFRGKTMATNDIADVEVGDA